MRPRKWFFAGLAALALAGAGCAHTPGRGVKDSLPPPPAGTKWELAWADELLPLIEA